MKDAPHMPRPATMSGDADLIAADIDAQIRAAQPKTVWASKTVWANVIAIVASLLVAFGLDLDLTPERQAALAGGIVAVVNIVLRFKTTKGVKVR